jgi:hypothetical protein
MDEFYVALLAFVSAVVGSVLTAWANKNHDISRFERQNRNEAYLAYLNGISRISFLSEDPEGMRSALMAMAEARGRVALYGSKEVVEGLSKAFTHGPNLWADEARSDVSDVIEAMRRDSQAMNEYSAWKPFKKRPSRASLFELLYGANPPRKIK